MTRSSEFSPPSALPLFWMFQIAGWTIFWGTMLVAGLSQWPLGFTVVHKTLLTLPGFFLSLLLRWIFRLAARRGASLPLLAAASFPLSWVAAAAWMAIFHLAVDIDSAWSRASSLEAIRGRFPDFNDAIYYAFLLVAWCLLYFGIQTYLAHEADRRRLRTAESLAHEARLRALRLQLDPHFLFNALNSLSTLIAEERNAEANRMLSQLADFLRMTLDAPSGNEVPLGTEIDLARRYLEVERSRFGDRLRIEMTIDPATTTALVPVMILQPLVENAVRHAVQMRPEGGTIGIAAARDSSWLTLRVEDDGAAADGVSATSAGVGIANTRDRLEQLYGRDCELRFDRAASGGVSVLLRLPFRAGAVEA